MSYRELVAELAREHAEEFSDALLELGALSVSVEDADADTPDEQPLFGEPGLTPDRTAWQRSRVIALLAAEHEPAVLLAAAANEVGLAAAPSFTVRDVEEQDWVRLTQSQFDPIPIGERIWVKFDTLENVFGLTGLVLVVFVIAAFRLGGDYGQLWQQASHPGPPHGEDWGTYWFMAVALFASAMTPYEVFFFSSGAVEERWTTKDLLTSRINVSDEKPTTVSNVPSDW